MACPAADGNPATCGIAGFGVAECAGAEFVVCEKSETAAASDSSATGANLCKRVSYRWGTREKTL
jgi:hypothetical protein